MSKVIGHLCSVRSSEWNLCPVLGWFGRLLSLYTAADHRAHQNTLEELHIQPSLATPRDLPGLLSKTRPPFVFHSTALRGFT